MIDYVDIVFCAEHGDSGKGKVVSALLNNKNYGYDIVARWAGSSNAGHTIVLNGTTYKTHLIPSGVFHDKLSIVGPGCVVNPESFYKEVEKIKFYGLDTSLIKISPRAHIITQKHIDDDSKNSFERLGTTKMGVGPAYSDRAARTGILAGDVIDKQYLWDEKLYGRIIMEGAQGFWLDLDQGNYPYVTSSITLPYGAMSLGFSHRKIRKVFACAKIYSTRSGVDPILFPESLLDDPIFSKIGEIGIENGTTTGRRRKVNWLNLDRLNFALNMTQPDFLIINKVDILEEVGIFRLFHHEKLIEFSTMEEMKEYILDNVKSEYLEKIVFSGTPDSVLDL